jgi:hypothetical protein
VTLAEDRLRRARNNLAITVAALADENRWPKTIPVDGELGDCLRRYRAARDEVREENRYLAEQAEART